MFAIWLLTHRYAWTIVLLWILVPSVLVGGYLLWLWIDAFVSVRTSENRKPVTYCKTHGWYPAELALTYNFQQADGSNVVTEECPSCAQARITKIKQVRNNLIEWDKRKNKPA